MADGWRVLSEWGSIDRFGTGVMIGSHDGFMAAGWRLGAEYDTPPGNFDHHNYATDPLVTQWFRGGSSGAAYEHRLPMGTTQVVVSFAGAGSYTCTASLYDHAGAELWSHSRTGDSLAAMPDPEVVSVNTSAGGATPVE